MDWKVQTLIKELTPNLSETWDRYILHHPDRTVYHLSGWKDVIEKTFGHKGIYLYAQNNNELVGVLPLILMKSRLFGSFLVSLPYLNYGGILADDLETEILLKDEAVAIARANRVDFVEFRHEDMKYLSMQTKHHKVAMQLELPENAEILWKNFNAKVRNQIRKAEKNDLEVISGSLEMLDDFYYIFSRNMRDLGTPVYSKLFFKHILEEFQQARIFVIHNEFIPIAAGFTIGMREKLDIPWASSLRGFNYSNCNMLLYWKILEYACKKGYHIFDFGRCTPGESHYRFKKQWGAQPVQLNWQYWMANGNQLPDISPTNIKYRLLISTWKRLPVKVTNRIGPAIVKNIP